MHFNVYINVPKFRIKKFTNFFVKEEHLKNGGTRTLKNSHSIKAMRKLVKIVKINFSEL